MFLPLKFVLTWYLEIITLVLGYILDHLMKGINVVTDVCSSKLSSLVAVQLKR